MEGEYLSLDTAKKIEAVKKVKAILPEGVEAVVISKDDYDRLSGELTKENIELKLEIERLKNIIDKAYKEAKKQNEEADFQEETDLSVIVDILVEGQYAFDRIKELKGSDKE